jgi:succinate dehydrogenase flavin-adding protein (antitoxin of CptAB toxin-antitoxin module)
LENRSVFIKKLIYRSKYTGTRETDILLGTFAEKHLVNLSDENLLAYEQLLQSGDPRIWRLSIDIEQTETEKEKTLINLIRDFKGF